MVATEAFLSARHCVASLHSGSLSPLQPCEAELTLRVNNKETEVVDRSLVFHRLHS